MMGRWRQFGRDQGGSAAIEFALICPILAAVLIMGADGWLRVNQTVDMRTAVQTGGRYYQMGGADEVAARSLALRSWRGAPEDAEFTASRVCKCGDLVVSCTSACANADTPITLIQLNASGTYEGLLGSRELLQSEIVRVR